MINAQKNGEKSGFGKCATQLCKRVAFGVAVAALLFGPGLVVGTIAATLIPSQPLLAGATAGALVGYPWGTLFADSETSKPEYGIVLAVFNGLSGLAFGGAPLALAALASEASLVLPVLLHAPTDIPRSFFFATHEALRPVHLAFSLARNIFPPFVKGIATTVRNDVGFLTSPLISRLQPA
jgi:hypothetical protein